MTEERTRIHTRISEATEKKIEMALPLSNAQSRNEFVEQALIHYCNYLKTKDELAMLPPVMAAALRATIQSSEDRIARLLFKLAVELSMTMNIVAAGKKVSDEDLKRLRIRCIREVKQNNGQVTLLDAMHYQHDEDEETLCQD